MEQNNYLVFQNIVHFYYQRLIIGIQTVCFLPAVVDNTPSFSAWIWILYYFVPFVYFRSCYYQQRFALVYGSMEDPALTLTLPASAALRDSPLPLGPSLRFSVQARCWRRQLLSAKPTVSWTRELVSRHCQWCHLLKGDLDNVKTVKSPNQKTGTGHGWMGG